MEEDEPDDPLSVRRVGSVLDEKWTLERILGTGGMGAVYAARHRNGARAAVKVLHPDLARRSDVRERFLREGYAANRVEHRGAVQVLDDDVVKDGPDEGTAYLVMEILEGESLEARLEREPKLTELEVLQIMNDVLAVLEAAHEHGVVHRDLKPANLFLNKDPAGPGVKVLDFGLARLEEARSVTGVGLALGTPSFMAPEQANGRREEIDARSDIFAMGATAFMILSGRGVHEADGVLELVARMGTLPAPKLREVAPHVSEAVARIVDRALEFKREDRYPSAAAMRADVEAALNALAAPPASTGPAAFARTSHGEEEKKSDGEERNGERGREQEKAEAEEAPRRRSRAPLVLALLAISGVGIGFVVSPDRDKPVVSKNAQGEMGTTTHVDASTDAPQTEGGPDASSAELAATTGSNEEDAGELADAAASEGDAGDGGDAGDEDDDDDDEDVDASDVAAIASARDAAPGAPGVVPRPPVVKRPRPAAVPGRPRHTKPFKRKPRRPQRPR